MELIEVRKRLQRAVEDVAFWKSQLEKKELQIQMEQQGEKNILTVIEIKDLIDEVFDVDIASKSRDRQMYVYPRAIYSHFCREYTNASLDAIGAYIGRNHATIINSKKTFDELFQNDYEFTKIAKMAIDKLHKLIKTRSSK